MYKKRTLKEKFENHIELIPFSECWWWIGSNDKFGYGNFTVNRKTQKAHRVSYSIYKGEIPKLIKNKRACVLHSCDNPACVNPKHLRLGTQKENNEDTRARKRDRPPRGEKSGTAILTEKQVLEIRSKHKSSKTKYDKTGYSPRKLAKEYGVGHRTIRDILSRKTWGHI